MARAMLTISALLCFTSLITLLCLTPNAGSQKLPPAKADGFVYTDSAVGSDTILIEAFLDPICPDSADAWDPLKEAVEYYGTRVWLVVHLLPLPYHDNAYVASRALHIANMLNTSATFPLLELFFKEQERFYNSKTFNMSRASVVSYIADFAVRVLGESYSSAVLSGFSNTQTDLKTRVSFKYSTSRGVYGTPFFFVNGFLLSDAESPTDLSGWKSIIDPLIAAQGDSKSFLYIKQSGPDPAIHNTVNNAGTTLDSTSTVFDNTCYKIILQGKSIFSSDQALLANPRTSALVNKFATSQGKFFDAFEESIVRINSLTSGQEVRLDCRVVR